AAPWRRAAATPTCGCGTSLPRRTASVPLQLKRSRVLARPSRLRAPWVGGNKMTSWKAIPGAGSHLLVPPPPGLSRRSLPCRRRPRAGPRGGPPGPPPPPRGGGRPRDPPTPPGPRRIRSLVEPLDLAPLLDSYAGVGSPASPPRLLLQLALFEAHRKHLSPAL